jgi:hypothetical protein
MSEELHWFPLRAGAKLIALFALKGGPGSIPELVAVSYLVDEFDLNFDGNSSIKEHLEGRLISTAHTKIDQKILDEIWRKAESWGYDSSTFVMYTQHDYNLRARLLIEKGKEAIAFAVDMIYYRSIIGGPLSSALTAAGITGVRKFVFKKAFKSLVKGIVIEGSKPSPK